MLFFCLQLAFATPEIKPAENPQFTAPVKPQAPTTQQSVDQQKLDAIRAYKRKRLSIGERAQLSGGQIIGGAGLGFYRGFGGGMIYNDPVRIHRRFFVFQGNRIINSVTFLKLIGEQKQAEKIQARILKLQKQSRLGRWASYLGLATIVSGFVVSQNATNQDDFDTGNYISWGGIGLTVGGIIGGGVPASRAARLSYPFMVYPGSKIQHSIDAFNDDLRRSLKLSADDVLTIETAVRTSL